MPESLLFGKDGHPGFIENLNDGHFDVEQGEKIKNAAINLVDQIKKSDISNTAVADLCETMYFICAFAEYNETPEFIKFEEDMTRIVNELYEN